MILYTVEKKEPILIWIRHTHATQSIAQNRTKEEKNNKSRVSVWVKHMRMCMYVLYEPYEDYSVCRCEYSREMEHAFGTPE